MRKKQKVSENEMRQILEGAKRYAELDKSDPFAFNRAMSHSMNGIANFVYKKNNDRVPAHYDAKFRRVEKTTAFGDTYQVVEYYDGARP